MHKQDITYKGIELLVSYHKYGQDVEFDDMVAYSDTDQHRIDAFNRHDFNEIAELVE